MKSLFNRKTLGVALLVVLCSLALGSWAGGKEQKSNVYRDLDLFVKVLEKIQNAYVDEVDTHKLVNSAIENMLKELDPHSQYLTGLDYEDLMLSTQGEFGGLGIFISFRDNYPTVISAIEGTPAEKAGIQGGDQIIEIEGESAEGWQVQRAVRYLRGDPGTSVRFKVSRPGIEESLEYSLTREEIKVSSVSYSGKFGDVGYVRLTNFSKNSREELESALDDLEKQKMKTLVLDLRSNPGGLLQAATGVSELFLERGKLVVYTQGRLEQNNQRYIASKGPKYEGYPIVVMVNGASASASEIVAGALQDWDAAFVVGQTTFGKGTVQTVFSLSDSQAVKLTTAKYYTPSGRSIHRDEEPHDDLATMTDEADGEEYALSPKAESPELDENRPVFHTASGRVVFGGGGITPDLEVEPVKYGDIERRLEAQGLFFTFAVDYSTKHKVTRDFKVTDQVLADFKKTLEKREFKYEEKDMSGESLEYIKKAITREIISKNFGRKEMYRVMLENDRDFQQVLSIIREAPTLKDMYSYAGRHRDVKKASLK